MKARQRTRQRLAQALASVGALRPALAIGRSVYVEGWRGRRFVTEECCFAGRVPGSSFVGVGGAAGVETSCAQPSFSPRSSSGPVFGGRATPKAHTSRGQQRIEHGFVGASGTPGRGPSMGGTTVRSRPWHARRAGPLSICCPARWLVL